MKQMPNESVDLVLTDPPYKDYISQRPNNDYAKPIDKGAFTFEKLVSDIERVLKPNRHFYIWCCDVTVADAIIAVKNSKTLKFKNILKWVKNNWGAGDCKGAYGRRTELCIFGQKGRREFFTNRATDVFYANRIPPKRGKHPTVKPVSILQDWIERSTLPGEVVFDPYAGSHSMAESAKLAGRDSISFELDSQYCDLGITKLT